ncbi:hypothetical protein KKA33_01580 [Patescibacteria group bacterium]|nr:hypothetical protein [Patescibacteria group bacterium]
MRHNQKNEREPAPVDEAIEARFSFEDHEWGYENESDSAEEAIYTYDPAAQLTDNQEEEEAVKSMAQEELENILDELNKPEFVEAHDLCSTIRKAVTNALRKFPHAEVIQLFPKRKPQSEPVPQPETKRKPIDLTKRLPKNKSTFRYTTNARVHDLFPKSKPQPEPQPVPNRKLNEVSNIADYRKPGWEIVRYDENTQMYEFPGLS